MSYHKEVFSVVILNYSSNIRHSKFITYILAKDSRVAHSNWRVYTSSAITGGIVPKTHPCLADLLI